MDLEIDVVFSELVDGTTFDRRKWYSCVNGTSKEKGAFVYSSGFHTKLSFNFVSVDTSQIWTDLHPIGVVKVDSLFRAFCCMFEGHQRFRQTRLPGNRSRYFFQHNFELNVIDIFTVVGRVHLAVHALEITFGDGRWHGEVVGCSRRFLRKFSTS